MMWRLGVVGSPIQHSLTPQLHDAGLAMAGLKGTSERIELKASEAKKVKKWMGKKYDGLSVTMPLKGAAAKYCDVLGDVATRTGVVNSLLYRDGVLHGANKDGQGFLDSLYGSFGVIVENLHVVVLGSGGAAAGIVDALVNAQVGSISVHARNESKVDSLVRRYTNVYGHTLRYRPVDLIVNALPSHARKHEAAVMQGVTSDTIAVDITYEPRMSGWRALHDAEGCRTQNGLAMLAYQAALQMQWWFETPIDGAHLLKVVS